jgi:hypothetical protein
MNRIVFLALVLISGVGFVDAARANAQLAIAPAP